MKNTRSYIVWKRYCGFASGTEVNWVQCDRCEEWFHLLCIGMGEDEISEHEDYVCYKCKSGRSKIKAHTSPRHFTDSMAPLMMAIQDDLMGEPSSGLSSSDENLPPGLHSMPQASGYTILPSNNGSQQPKNSIMTLQEDEDDDEDDALMITGAEVAAPQLETVIVESSHALGSSPSPASHGASPVDGVEIGEDIASKVITSGFTGKSESRGLLSNKNADSISEVSNTMSNGDGATYIQTGSGES